MAFTIILYVLIIILFIPYYILYRAKREPPCMSGYLPIIGHIHQVVGGNDRIIEVIKRGSKECFKNGGAVTFWMGLKPIYVLTDPDECLTVANTCFETTYSFGKEVFGNGLLMCPVSTWKRHRKLLSPAFNQQVLDTFVPIFNQQARRLVKDLAVEVGTGAFDNLPYLRRNTLQTICLTAMGIDISEESDMNRSYLECFDKILNSFVERFMKVWLHSDFIYGFSELKKTQDQYLKSFHRMSATVLQRKKAEVMAISINNNNDQKTSSGRIKSFIDMLLEDGVFTDEEVKEEVDTFIAAGHETIATLLVFVLLLIGSFPKVQERILSEIEEIVQGPDEDVTRHELSRLVYLEVVIKETLRYFSLVPFVLRHLDQDIVLKHYTLRAQNDCMLLLYGIHHHEMWGPDADEFKPERWLDPATMPAHPNAFAGFSLGKRNCIGRNFAIMSVKTIIVHVLRNYKISGDHRNVKMKVDFVFRAAAGYYISLEKRK